MTHTCYGAVRRIDEIALDGHPDMRMRRRAHAREDKYCKCTDKCKKAAKHHVVCLQPRYRAAQLRHHMGDCGGMEALRQDWLKGNLHLAAWPTSGLPGDVLGTMTLTGCTEQNANKGQSINICHADMTRPPRPTSVKRFQCSASVLHQLSWRQSRSHRLVYCRVRLGAAPELTFDARSVRTAAAHSGPFS